jgi:hypothetical protein
MDITLTVKQVIDEYADTSDIGQYTDKPEEWAIVRATGEYCKSVYQRRRIIAALTERIYAAEEQDIVDETYIMRMDARIKRIESSGETEFPRGGREYRYFKPYAGGEPEGTPEYRKYGMQDFSHMERLCRGDWHYIGIVATVTVTRDDGFSREWEESLWGVESDSGAHIDEMARELIAALAGQIAEYGEMPEWGGEYVA